MQSSHENQYYDGDEFNYLLNRVFENCSVNDFSVIHVNIRFMRTNGDAHVVYLSLLQREFDIVCFTEIWVK